MNFKNRKAPGFSLIEVMLSLAIMGTLITALMSLQQAVVSSLGLQSGRLQRIFDARNFLHEYMLKDEKEYQITTEDPVAELIFEKKDIPSQSSLQKFEDCKSVQVTVRWDTGLYQDEYALVSFVYEPKKEEK